jgi:hypothetical protein
VRVFAVKLFAKFQKQERISDAALCEAVSRAQRGLIDADLGQGLIKQRVARTGQGRSGGYRTLVAYRIAGRAVFLFGFAKSDRANISNDELQLLRQRASQILSLDDAAIEARIDDGDLFEVSCDDKDQEPG